MCASSTFLSWGGQLPAPSTGCRRNGHPLHHLSTRRDRRCYQARAGGSLIMAPIGITAPSQLLVEGNDPKNFMEAFLDHLPISPSPSTIQIQNFGGVDELQEFLSAFVKMPDFGTITKIGVIRDAETNATGAFQSVQSSLQNAGLQAPNAVGTPSGGNPAVTVLILPGNGQSGMLETLLCKTFVGTKKDKCLDNFFKCIPGNIPQNMMPKARAHAWIATQQAPHVSVGVAAKKRFWNLNHVALNPVRDFLMSLK